MLNVFPNLLAYWLAAPLILRAALGLSFLRAAYRERKINRLGAVIKLLTGTAVLIGFFTQISALAAAVISLHELWQRGINEQRLFKLALAVSLLFLGPGLLSLDLPL
ncbi:MAG: hypothetical protein HY481_00010 [Candidatus Vogelbacteria bacterium]|nr:hypothetical protein [Candidatus Vogelbacteria bacterium]